MKSHNKPSLEQLKERAALWYCNDHGSDIWWISYPGKIHSSTLSNGLSFWTDSSYSKVDFLKMRDTKFVKWLDEEQIMLKDNRNNAWFQDIGKPLDDNNEEFFYKAGYSSYCGTSKLHTSIDCRHLYGRPDWLEGNGIFRDTREKGSVSDSSICKSCLKANNRLK